MDQVDINQIAKAMSLVIVEPVGIVVAQRSDGSVNYMPCGWNMKVSYDPPILALSLFKDSATREIILSTSEFSLCYGDEIIRELALKGSSIHGYDMDKAKMHNVQLAESKIISSPGIKGARVHFECKVRQIIDCGTTTLLVADICGAHMDLSTRSQVFYSHKDDDKHRVFCSVEDTRLL
jgi:flavin reductase (DIM6/NTAB) family NADH-FMN oxidoreductase RutF